MAASAVHPERVPIDLIHLGDNVRGLDQAHVDALAASIKLRGLIVPLTVRPDGDCFTLIAGHHRHAACLQAGLADVPVTVREHDQTSGDTAAENVLRKQLSPLGEARAVAQMLEEGYTLDGAAAVLGWTRARHILSRPSAASPHVSVSRGPLHASSQLTGVAEILTRDNNDKARLTAGFARQPQTRGLSVARL